MTFSNKEIFELSYYYQINALTLETLNNAIAFDEANIGDTIINYNGDEVIATDSRGKHLIMKRAPEVIDGDVLATVTIKDIYGKDNVVIPDGYYYEAFGLPKAGDLILQATSSTSRVMKVYNNYFSPHIILKRKNEK